MSLARRAAAIACLPLVLAACGNSSGTTSSGAAASGTASTAPPGSAGPTAAASSAAAGASAPVSAELRANLKKFDATCTWGAPLGCPPFNTYLEQQPAEGAARTAVARACLALTGDPEVQRAAATCAGSLADHSMILDLWTAFEKATNPFVRADLARGIARAKSDEGEAAARAIRFVRANLANLADPEQRGLVQRALDALEPDEDSKREPTPEAYALALELVNTRGLHHQIESTAGSLLLATPSKMPELCKLFATRVETATAGEDWGTHLTRLTRPKLCRPDFDRVFPLALKKLESDNDGKGITSADIDAVAPDADTLTLTAAQKKSLIAALGTLGKKTESDDIKRACESVTKRFSK